MTERTLSTTARQPVREQRGPWDVDLEEPVSPPTYRIARAHASRQAPPPQMPRPLQQGASRHHAGHSYSLHPEDEPYVTDEQENQDRGATPTRIPARRSSSSQIDEGLDDARLPRSTARRYRRTTEAHPAPSSRAKYHLHWSVFVGLVMLCMLVGFILFSALSTWIGHTADFVHYGMPRTFQMDAVVGHQDSAAHPSHFLALNLDGQLSVIELPGGELSKAVVYPGPRIYGPGRELVALTLSVAHDASGKAELVLHYQNNEVILYDGKDGKFHEQP